MLAGGSLELIDGALCPAPPPIGEHRDHYDNHKDASVHVQGQARQGKHHQGNGDEEVGQQQPSAASGPRPVAVRLMLGLRHGIPPGIRHLAIGAVARADGAVPHRDGRLRRNRTSIGIAVAGWACAPPAAVPGWGGRRHEPCHQDRVDPRGRRVGGEDVEPGHRLRPDLPRLRLLLRPDPGRHAPAHRAGQVPESASEAGGPPHQLEMPRRVSNRNLGLVSTREHTKQAHPHHWRVRRQVLLRHQVRRVAEQPIHALLDPDTRRHDHVEAADHRDSGDGGHWCAQVGGAQVQPTGAQQRDRRGPRSDPPPPPPRDVAENPEGEADRPIAGRRGLGRHRSGWQVNEQPLEFASGAGAEGRSPALVRRGSVGRRR
jgi:hypothetical protein